jgi:hypothetical protein
MILTVLALLSVKSYTAATNLSLLHENIVNNAGRVVSQSIDLYLNFE